MEMPLRGRMAGN